MFSLSSAPNVNFYNSRRDGDDVYQCQWLNRDIHVLTFTIQRLTLAEKASTPWLDIARVTQNSNKNCLFFRNRNRTSTKFMDTMMSLKNRIRNTLNQPAVKVKKKSFSRYPCAIPSFIRLFVRRIPFEIDRMQSWSINSHRKSSARLVLGYNDWQQEAPTTLPEIKRFACGCRFIEIR